MNTTPDITIRVSIIGHGRRGPNFIHNFDVAECSQVVAVGNLGREPSQGIRERCPAVRPTSSPSTVGAALRHRLNLSPPSARGSRMSPGPRVSLVVTCHNYRRFLGETLDSLVAQTLTDWEAIVIDDASTDETGEVLARYRDLPRLRVVRHRERAGHIHSCNEGLEVAEGRYVGLLAADDYLLRCGALERQLALFEAHPCVGLVYSAHAIVQEAHRFGTSYPGRATRCGRVSRSSAS